MLTQNRYVPQLVEQFNELIDRKFIQSISIESTENTNDEQNTEPIVLDNTVVEKFLIDDQNKNNCQINNDFVISEPKVDNCEENDSIASFASVSSVDQKDERFIETSVSDKLNTVSNEEIVKESETIGIRNDIKSEQKCFESLPQTTEVLIPEVIKLNPILENLMVWRKHCFITKTIVPKEICGVCNKMLEFSEKYIQCINCIAISHLDCNQGMSRPCIPYTNPNLRPGRMISNYVYPAFKPSIPAILVHCCREIEERIYENSAKGLYVMRTEDLKQVKDLCERIIKSKNGFSMLKNFSIDLICGAVKKFLTDLYEPLVGNDIWKQFSSNMRKKDETELQSLLKNLIKDLKLTNKDSLCFLVLHLQNLSKARKGTLEAFTNIFCPIICGETEVNRKLTLMSTLLNLNSEFWVKNISNYR